MRELAEEKGCCEILFLPSYLPDFSPIEEAFSKLKARPRRAQQIRTKEAARRGDRARAGGASMAEDARDWFGHCGYAVAQPLRELL